MTIEIEQAATVSILYDALLQKKSNFCHAKMVDESKKLLTCKRDVDECLERIDEIEEQLADIKVELAVPDDVPMDDAFAGHTEAQALLSEKKEEELLLIQMSKVYECRKATMRMLVKHKSILDSSRKSLRNRQRRIVEKAFRTGLLACQS
ncbi:hypothetical protein ACHHYP_07716 [Achlya hypogyna]|uniref:Uncharacterized protein n=1 Tax=Achlya hypogyna TaxID=1202772 RepID=A0A1V9YQJ6_ACHHY|nr:hypothetical protein ACHHYP_07716 [Achlya hypogyna]